MVMLSEIRRHVVVDGRRRSAPLVDLAVDLAAGDYPPVTRILFKDRHHKQMEVPWEAVTEINWRRGQWRVADLTAARAAPPEALTRTVLLVRDVMDALVLDLAQRQAMRANDLWLRQEDDRVRLKAADVSPWAVLRRIGRGLFGRGGERHLVDWCDVEFLRGNPRAALAGGDYHRRITRLTPSAIARLAEDLPYHHGAELLTLIPDELAADTLELMTPERQLQVFEDLDEDQAVRLLALMAPDLATDLIGRLQPDWAQRCLEEMPAPEADRVVELLRYPEHTAGGIMSNDLPVVAESQRVAEARALHARTDQRDMACFVYVVDDLDTRRLVGIVALWDLVNADEAVPIREIMRPCSTVVDALESSTSAAWRLLDEHVGALPVVGRDGRLLGVVTLDAAVAQVLVPSWRDRVPRLFS